VAFKPHDNSQVKGGVLSYNLEVNDNQDVKDEDEIEDDKMSQEMRNLIGDRGAMIVFNHLKKMWSKKANFINETDYKLVFQNCAEQIITIDLLTNTCIV